MYLSFLHCVMSNVFSRCLHEKMLGCNKCIWPPFLHCAFSNVSSSCLPETMQSHTGCICFTCIHCVLLHLHSFLRQFQILQGISKCVGFFLYNVVTKCPFLIKIGCSVALKLFKLKTWNLVFLHIILKSNSKCCYILWKRFGVLMNLPGSHHSFNVTSQLNFWEIKSDTDNNLEDIWLMIYSLKTFWGIYELA